MRVEVWVHAVGEGRVAPDAIDRARSLLGDSCLGATATPGRWSLGLAVDAETLDEAMSIASTQAQACAAAAGLPAWPITNAGAEGPEKVLAPGFSTIEVATAFTMTVTADSGDDDGTAGDREPRIPSSPPPATAAAEELPRSD
jgi:hypothetical protein